MTSQYWLTFVKTWNSPICMNSPGRGYSVSHTGVRNASVMGFAGSEMSRTHNPAWKFVKYNRVPMTWRLWSENVIPWSPGIPGGVQRETNVGFAQSVKSTM